ncbi:MAG: hypothetical protein M0R03_17740, partial [Novosphingobium sp.]|nr:hypothetical protein [Novosphingobium sp.]
SRIDGESFALLLPYASIDAACALGKPIIETLEDIRQSIPGQGVAITASGGLAAIGATVDQTMRDAELSLFMAKTRGGGCLHVPALTAVASAMC